MSTTKCWVAFRQAIRSVKRGIYEDTVVFLAHHQGRTAILGRTGETGSRKLCVREEQVFFKKADAVKYMADGLRGYVVAKGDDWLAPRLIEVDFYINADGNYCTMSVDKQEEFCLGKPSTTVEGALTSYLRTNKFDLRRYKMAIESAKAAFEEAKKFDAILKKTGVRT